MPPPIPPRVRLQIDCSPTLCPEERTEWQAFMHAAQHQHPRQDPRFAAVEEADGRSVLYVTGRGSDGALRAAGLFSLRRYPALSSIFIDASCLSGPVCDDAETLVDFLEGVRRLPPFARVGRVRATPFWTDQEADTLARVFVARGWRIDEAEPFRQTGWVDLTPRTEDILAAFSKSARRELRRAERQGIVLRQLTRPSEARDFLASLNRLRTSRGLRSLPEPGFLKAFETIHADGDTGVILGAFHGDDFVSGLQLYRGRFVAHGRHFTLEPERLHALSNLRIAPLVWYEGMLWAKAQGCRALDVEGWRATVQEGDSSFGIHKYKGELAPAPVRRIAEHGRTANPIIDVARSAGSHLRNLARHTLRRMKGRT